MNKHYQQMRKQVGLAGAVIGSLMIGLPVMAMPRIGVSNHLAQANPHPSIFNEPPYNHSGSMSGSGSSGTPPMMQPMPESGTTPSSSSPSTDPTSPQNPNLPADVPSPYLQQQQTGGSTQPSVPGSTMKKPGSSRSQTDPTSPQNPNLPPDVPSPYLQQQQTGDSKQPPAQGTSGPNPASSMPGPYTQQQQKPSGPK